jgi:hypothetical protein
MKEPCRTGEAAGLGDGDEAAHLPDIRVHKEFLSVG